MLRGKLDPDALVVDYNTCEVGVGELCNVGTTAVRLLIVTPQGKRFIRVEDAKTYGGVITEEFAKWLTETYCPNLNYSVILEKVHGGFFKIISPYASLIAKNT